MRLKILGSSSAGNCYLLEADNGECLIIEAGITWRKIQQALNFNLQRVAGCIITHEHGDHAKSINNIIDAHIPCYMSYGTAEVLNVVGRVHCIKPMQQIKVGTFNIMPFDTEHDASEPFGYLINHKECGTTLFATDTYYLQYKFKGLSNIIIECNYDVNILNDNIRKGIIPITMKKRTLRSHMSYDTCVKTLLANDLTKVNNIVLIHLSPSNSNADKFKCDMEQELGRPVIIADAGMDIKFDKSPF